ncbi:MAG TPA: pyridoxal-phosphate dependent enzyme, partial [Vicinamibacteria bacterium]|nr:pyridoxal-phosphate dependent enzyme [Vicinamibacteria bacterium]
GEAEDEEILETQRQLARTEGIWAGPTGVAALAVLVRLLARHELDPAQRFAVVISETGLKTEAALPDRHGEVHDYASLRRLVEERLAAS